MSRHATLEGGLTEAGRHINENLKVYDIIV